LGCGKAIINPHIAAVGPAQLLQFFHEDREAYLPLLIILGRGREYADAPYAVGLLCACRKRPSECRAADERDEFSPPHRSPRVWTGDRSNSHVCSGRGQCPLWVISRHMQRTSSCPLYPQ